MPKALFLKVLGNSSAPRDIYSFTPWGHGYCSSMMSKYQQRDWIAVIMRDTCHWACIRLVTRSSWFSFLLSGFLSAAWLCDSTVILTLQVFWWLNFYIISWDSISFNNCHLLKCWAIKMTYLPSKNKSVKIIIKKIKNTKRHEFGCALSIEKLEINHWLFIIGTVLQFWTVAW
jgi:hypothetical protein